MNHLRLALNYSNRKPDICPEMHNTDVESTKHFYLHILSKPIVTYFCIKLYVLYCIFLIISFIYNIETLTLITIKRDYHMSEKISVVPNQFWINYHDTKVVCVKCDIKKEICSWGTSCVVFWNYFHFILSQIEYMQFLHFIFFVNILLCSELYFYVFEKNINWKKLT